jgi:hypothetical protein
MNNKLRKITWRAFKPSGKWYADGDAMIDSESYYFDTIALLEDIDDTQTELRKGCIVSREFILIVDGDDNNPDTNFPFMTRLIKSMEEKP